MNLKIGQIVQGKINGIQPYGAFLLLDDQKTQGLIHISECKVGYVDNLYDIFKIGQEVEAMVIDIDQYNGQISLSTRELSVPEKSTRPGGKHYWTTRNYHTGFAPNGKAMNGWVHEALKKYKKA